jgi:hypothetical protein
MVGVALSGAGGHGFMNELFFIGHGYGVHAGAVAFADAVSAGELGVVEGSVGTS